MKSNLPFAKGPEIMAVRKIRWPCLLPLFLAVSLAFIIINGCGTAEEKSVSADEQQQTTRDGEKTGFLSGLIKNFNPPKIPSGTPIQVRLLNSISSRTASPGEEFQAELTAPVNVEGKVILPTGVRVKGRVVSANPSGGLHNPGTLRLTLDSVQTLSGAWMPVSTSFVSAKGNSHKRRNLTLIGGGAGVGGLIGAIAGGGKGAAIGAASGAAAGTAGAYATGKKEAVLSAETKLTFATVTETVMKN